MSLIEILLLIFSIRSFASPIVARATAYDFPGDAPFSVAAATLAAALTCPNGNPTTALPPVLLVHGTGSTGEQSWGEGYVPALNAAGYTPCYVTLPGRAMGDMQISAEYVAYSIHQLSQLASNQQISIITHSQGGPDTQWALQWWPSTRSVTNAFIALSPDFTGIDFAGSDLSNICVGGLCQACLWQQSAGSQFYDAMHFENFDALVPTTAIWTEFDGVVEPPQANAELPSATAISVQSLCPARVTTHAFMPIDAAAYAIALDALTHGGVASLSRVEPDALETCLEIVAPQMSVSIATSLQDLLDDLVDGFLLGSPRVSSEPPVDAYADAYQDS